MASYNTHSQHQHHHHHQQQPQHQHPHHTTGTNSIADVLNCSALAAGGSSSNTQQQHSQHPSHHHPSQHLHHHLSPHHPHHPPPVSLHSNVPQQHFERSSSTTTSATTTFLVPVTSSALAPLDTTFLSATASPHFVTSSPVTFNSPHSGTSASSSTSSSSYTFVQIKREPCQVSEVTTSNTNHHQHHHQQSYGSLTSAAGSLTAAAAAAAAKTMSSSTLTTLVKIEASSPKVHDMDKGHVTGAANMVNSSNNTVPIGIAVARKRPQETTAAPPGPPPSLTSSSALPLSQQLNKDMNCFGIRVADLGGVGTGCGNFYFTGNGDLMTSSATADELALNAASLQSVNRASSTFWQYPNALPIESVISMSPATVGLQYSREASRGQVVLLPATATSLDPFQQAAAAAFVWPSYIPQGTAPATLQPPPNFIFPSMSPHSTLQAAAAAQPYSTSLQFLGSNYLTAAAAAAAAAAATSTLCQHNQQTNSTSSSINLSLGGSVVSGAASGTTMSSSSSTTTRFMSLATSAPPGINDTGQPKGIHGKTLAPAPGPPTLALAPAPSLMSSSGSAHPHAVPTQPLLIPPSALKLEDWSGADFMAAASKTTTTTLTAAAIAVPPPPTQYEMRDKHTSATTNVNATNLLELPAPTAQALNLMRLPTPPTSATMETATAAAAVAASGTSHLPPLLFQAANSSPTPTLLNLSATLNRVTASNSSASSHSSPHVTVSLAPSTNYLNASPATASSVTATIGPPTPLGDDMALNFKSNLDGTPPQIVVGVPRVVNPALPTIPSTQPPPQMQDVNIQTDTPVCSEDENSSCPLNQAQCGAISNVEPCTTAQCTPPLTQNDELYHDTEAQQPLELTKTHRPPNSPQVESSSLPEVQDEEDEHNMKSPLKQCHVGDYGMPEKVDASHSITPAIISSTSAGHSTQEDLTGLELLSNISTCSLLVKSGAIRVKQEPLDPVVDQNMCHVLTGEQHTAMESNSFAPVDRQSCDQLNSLALHADHYPTPPSPPSHHQPPSVTHTSLSNLTPIEVEPLGGLKLLCALAEQRIQEEEEVQSTTLNATNGLFRPTSSDSPHSFATSSFPQSNFVKPSTSASTTFQLEAQNTTFPSLETLELPSTSGNCFAVHISGCSDAQEVPVKRKKHKHSKSSKSSNPNGSSSSSKKSQKCGKKNKKKYSKEKKRHKLLAETQQADLDFDDPQLQQELQNAFQNCADPNYQRMGGKWPTPQEIFSIMESSMRMRLADITRQYRKKKRKLDEISKNKKKKKCSKLQAAAQQLSLVGNSTLSLVATDRPSATNASSLTSSPLCDYKFGKFSSKSCTTATTNYLAPSSFIRFATDSTKSQSHHLHQTHPQFPPPPDLELENENTTSTASNTTTTAITAAPIYKPVRLEPSSLSAASAEQRTGNSTCSSGVLRLAQKHASSEKLSQVIVSKERRLGGGSGSTSSRRSSGEEDEEVDHPATYNDSHQNGRNGRRSTSTDNESAVQQSTKLTTTSSHKMNPIDRSLMLTQDHLFRKETRVLTDMGGLFYAGIMKPLQPPDVYAITLDGERGNKSHIMSREEIFKDTILEVAPKTVEDVPVGTRLCAYWSQQYRCLYPGRAIESESSDDGVTSQEFVSVEFDDGDSGRIRLQNIRYLLSDYPIVEYNDNPLYSLGKQKKANANKTPNNNDTDHHQHQHHEADDHGSGNSNNNNGLDKRLTSNGSHRDYHQATAMEIFAAKRSEKKRNKSLKKKSQNACSANIATTNGTSNVSSSSSMAVATSSANGSLESSDCLRKHHKHKKRKKHKKHRKNLMEIGIVSEMERNTFSPSSSFNNKTERTIKETPLTPPTAAAAASLQHHPTTEQQQHLPLLAEEVYDEEPEEDTGDQENNTQTEDSQMAEEDEDDDEDDEDDLNFSRIKHESVGNTGNQHHSPLSSSSGHAQQNVKVKTEHLEMEEESTSNLMSEISDEAKADDMIEHNSSKGSKIAAFLPERQLWGWLGTAYCKFGTKGSKGRIRKQFYKTIKRGKETITVGDCAVFLSTGRPDRPYIGRIESMWENSCNNKIVRVRWFYHPEETTGCPKLKFPGALFESPHEDENDVQTISHRCEVLQFARYFNKFGADSKQYQSIYDNNDTYYLAGFYNPRLQVLKLQDNIPTLEEQQSPQQQQPPQKLLLQLPHETQQQQQNSTNTPATTTIINNNTNANNNTTITE